MARLENSMFQLTGSIDGLTFVRDERGIIVKKKSSISRDRIMTHPNSRKTRENMKEMGVASKAAKQFRMAFSGEGRWIGSYFSGRMSGVLRRVVGMGEGERGKRSLDIRKNGERILKDFEFIESRPVLYSVGGNFMRPEFTPGRKKIRWESERLERAKYITSPKDATHMRYVMCVAGISSFKYDEKKDEYFPLTSWNERMRMTESGFVSLNKKVVSSVQMEIILGKEVPEEVGLIVSVGVEFWREINGSFLRMDKSWSMKVVGVE